MNAERVKAFVRNQKFQAFDELVERIVNDPNFTAIAVGTALFIIILTFVLIKLLTSSSKSATSVLILGLSESGKTRLFAKLLCQKPVDTVTSMQPNDGHVKVGKRFVHVVDCPGYDRLRKKMFDDHKSRAKAIIFVIDSVSFVSNNRDVAEFLYTVLSDTVVSKKRMPIIIACNKQDEPKAKSSKIISKQLEREINAIRETRKAALESTDGGDQAVILGNPNQDFKWTDVKNPIDFVDCSAATVDDDESIESVGVWLTKI